MYANLLFSVGSKLTPAHPYGDFKFRTYAPTAFRYFRDLFGISPENFLVGCFASSSEIVAIEIANITCPSWPYLDSKKYLCMC